MRLLRTREYFERTPLQVARSLLGDVLVHRLPSGVFRRGRIVETEAYLGPRDLAAHSSKGRTARTEVMFGQPGLVYVYFIYGMHHCINVVTGHGTAVLIRALEPLDELDARLDGPGRLTKVFGINRTHNGLDFAAADSPLFIEAGDPVPNRDVMRGPRVGLGACGMWADKPYRFRITPKGLQRRLISSTVSSFVLKPVIEGADDLIEVKPVVRGELLIFSRNHRARQRR